MEKRFFGKGRTALMTAVLAGLTSMSFAAAFTAGNLVVIRVGEGTRALSAAAEAVFLDEYTTAGSLVQSIAMPTTASDPPSSTGPYAFSMDGTQLAIGSLSLSTNNQYLVLGGYNAAIAKAAVSGTSSASNYYRVIARVDASGTVDTSTAFTDGFSAGRFAGVATDDGTHFWASGNGTGTGGVRYMASFGSATTSTYTVSNTNNVLFPDIYQGQLYCSINFNVGIAGDGRGVCTAGSGLPTTSGNSVQIFTGFPTLASQTTAHPLAPKGHWFKDANTLFIADSGSTANGGGLQKWTQSAGTWTETVSGVTFPYASGTTANGLDHLTGIVNGSNVTIYATSSDTTVGNSLVKWVSTDGGATGTMSTVVAAPVHPNGANFAAFRGIAFTPGTFTGVNDWKMLDEK